MSVAPELVFEVLSPSDRWSEVHVKVAEYLDVGVQIVCVLDAEAESAHLYYPDKSPEVFAADSELTFGELLGDLRVKVADFFK